MTKMHKENNLTKNQQIVLDLIEKSREPVKAYSILSNVKKKGIKDIAILYCVSNYPSSYKDFNFKNLHILKKKFNCVIGFSDHSNDDNVVKSAIAAGAEIIDKPTVRDNNLISATSGESGISDLLEMLAEAIKENNK